MATILGIIAALFAGLNIFQFIFLRSTKKKYEAEAEKSKAEAEAIKQSNESVAVDNLSKVLSEFKTVVSMWEKTHEEDTKLIQQLNDERLRVATDFTACSMMLCKHDGCPFREPIKGRGKDWFDTHKADDDLTDTIPIEEIALKRGYVVTRNK